MVCGHPDMAEIGADNLFGLAKIIGVQENSFQRMGFRTGREIECRQSF